MTKCSLCAWLVIPVVLPNFHPQGKFFSNAHFIIFLLSKGNQKEIKTIRKYSVSVDYGDVRTQWTYFPMYKNVLFPQIILLLDESML